MSKRSSRRRPRNRPALPGAQAGAVLHAMLQRAVQTQLPCLLCGAVPFRVGCFLPTSPVAWGFPPGHGAARVYTLCRACLALPDHGERAEAVLWAERQLQRRARWN